MWVPGSLRSCVRRISDGRVERRNLLNFYLCVEQPGRIQMFQLGSAKHINQVSLDLYICPQNGQQRRKEPLLLCLTLIVSDAITVM